MASTVYQTEISNTEARKGLLAARRMVPDVHASKLPARESRNIAHDSMRVRVANKHDRIGQLKKCRAPLLFSMKVLFIEEKNVTFVSRKKSVKSSSGTKLAEKGRKIIFQERKEENEKRDDCDRSVGHILFCRTFK